MKLDKDLYAIDKTLLIKAGDNISRKALIRSPPYPEKSLIRR